MSGIIGTLRMRTPNTELPEQPNGYVHLGCPMGYRSSSCAADVSFDAWRVPISYYACRQDQIENPSVNIQVQNMLCLDNTTPIPQFLEFPYIPSTDPMDTAKQVLAAWWSDGSIVP